MSARVCVCVCLLVCVCVCVCVRAYTYLGVFDGDLTPPIDGLYRFSVMANDGIRLTVDGTKLLEFEDAALTSHRRFGEMTSAPVYLQANRTYVNYEADKEINGPTVNVLLLTCTR